MFYHFSHWIEHFSEEECELIADIANGILAQQGVNVFGNILENGDPEHFGKQKKDHDTHNAMLVDIGLMGSLDPTFKVQRTKITEEQIDKAYMSREQRLYKNKRNKDYYNERSKQTKRRRRS